MTDFDHDQLFELVTEWVRDEGDAVLYEAQDVDSMAGSGYTIAYEWRDHFWVYDDSWGWGGPYASFEEVLDHFSLGVQAPSSGGHTTLGGSRLKEVLPRVFADFDGDAPTPVTVEDERWTLTRGPDGTVVWHPPEDGTALDLVSGRKRSPRRRGGKPGRSR